MTLPINTPATAEQRPNLAALVVALLTVGAFAGWAIASGVATTAAAIGTSLELVRHDSERKPPVGDIKTSLVGSYSVTGTDSDGQPYWVSSRLDISLAQSGALELNWDKGRSFGVGQVVGNALAVASLIRGRTAILIMEIQPDGSLSGRWSRRTDQGISGSETWKRLS